MLIDFLIHTLISLALTLVVFIAGWLFACFVDWHIIPFMVSSGQRAVFLILFCVVHATLYRERRKVNRCMDRNR